MQQTSKGTVPAEVCAEEYAAYQVSEADFQAAAQNASYWARRRCLKKMTKVKYTERYDAKAGGVVSDSRPPKDVEEYVKRFVWAYKDGGAKV